jgi:hypothetical protein
VDDVATSGAHGPVDDGARLSFGRHIVIGLACALVAPFTALAWPLALLTGMVIGRDRADRQARLRIGSVATIVRVLAVTGGVLGMMVLGAVLGGLVGFLIVALAASSEREAAGTSATDRTIARLLLVVTTTAGWLALVTLIGLQLTMSGGS